MNPPSQWEYLCKQELNSSLHDRKEFVLLLPEKRFTGGRFKFSDRCLCHIQQRFYFPRRRKDQMWEGNVQSNVNISSGNADSFIAKQVFRRKDCQSAA